MKTIGVLLSGCGFLDGAEIRESVLTLLALDQDDIKVTIMAPDQKQYHVVDHVKSDEAKGLERNLLEESARIARGEIVALDKVEAKDLDALIIPGGFGVAKNLCEFAFKGHQATVQEDVKKLILDLHKDKKPLGAICIAPALMGLVLGDKGVEVTIGDDKETAQEIEKTGAKHFSTKVNEIHVDEKNKVVSTPAYMYGDARLSHVSQGIRRCVEKVIDLA